MIDGTKLKVKVCDLVGNYCIEMKISWIIVIFSKTRPFLDLCTIVLKIHWSGYSFPSHIDITLVQLSQTDNSKTALITHVTAQICSSLPEICFVKFLSHLNWILCLYSDLVLVPIAFSHCWCTHHLLILSK